VIEVLGDRVSVHIDYAGVNLLRAAQLLRDLRAKNARELRLLDGLVLQLRKAGEEIRAAEAIAIGRRHEAAHRAGRGKG